MMRQYHRIRGELPEDVLLLFRLGDFYEMFFEDAKIASPILDVALTKRNGIPMCGVPHHAAANYISKLVEAGKRVALAEQTTVPQPGKIVEREVSQIITAGTVSDSALLDANRPNYVTSIAREGKHLGLAALDLSTGEFRLCELPDEQELADELARLQPSECIYSDEQEDLARLGGNRPCEGYSFLFEHARHLLKEHFRVQSLDGFGCAEMPGAVAAAGALVAYLRDQLRRDIGHVKNIATYHTGDYVLLDASTQSHLELVESTAGRSHTLLGALDRTATPMGSRTLRHWILHPLRDAAQLAARQDAIAAIKENGPVLRKLQEALKSVRDVERTLGRLSQGSGNGRDIRVLGQSLAQWPAVREQLDTLPGPPKLISELTVRLGDFPALIDLIDRAIVDEPPVSIKDGGIFKDGYSADLDGIREGSRKGKDWILELQTREAKRTGIKSLKVRFNSVFGYYIEVTKSNLAQVPDDYERKQTLANAERYITPELKEVENQILGADERARTYEYEAFLSLRETILEDLEALQNAARSLGTIDVLVGLAETARLWNYTRPRLTNNRGLAINDGRHPVLEQQQSGERFVPNDTNMAPDDSRLVIITGPNMAGKSTYIRQVALLTLMAQTGSFLPASNAEIGLVDRIFTRVGASDDLSRGQSTFMVEMNETSLIVHHATRNSLVILDEIGRGTSTFDGLSIAWSVAEYLHDVVEARTLFATHYHELTALAGNRSGVTNWNVAVREWNDEVIFLRKIIEGAADKSYGIQVARLAGLPPEILTRAREILTHLETGTPPATPGSQIPRSKPAMPRRRSLTPPDPNQMDLFS